MKTFLIRVTCSGLYDENPDELIAVKVPDNVELSDIHKEFITLNNLFLALKEIDYADSSDYCIENYVYEEDIEETKKMRDRIFKSEDEVYNVYGNDGYNASVLFSHLISLHDGWTISNDIASATFDMVD